MPKVNVSVDAKGQIHCEPDVLEVKGKSPAIQFLLVTEGYAFPKVGSVVLKKPSPDFPDPAKWVNGQHVNLNDLNKVKATHAYTVTLMVSATGKSIELDPEISNDGNGGG